MSHQLSLESVHEKLVLLEHFANGSQKYCAARLAGSEEDPGDGALDDYWGWLKVIVSSYPIECAVRVRILQDSVQGADAKKLADLDGQARSALGIGDVLDGNFDLSLRETCNKIIHASKVVPDWRSGLEGGVEYKYWTGDYRLSGTKGDESWILLLHVGQWARAMAKYLGDAESEELTIYVGQDWH